MIPYLLGIYREQQHSPGREFDDAEIHKNPMPGHLSELHPVNEDNTKGQFFRASFGKKPQVPKTARQAASLPGDISRGKRSSMPQAKTRPDSPVPSLQGPCDRSLK